MDEAANSAVEGRTPSRRVGKLRSLRGDLRKAIKPRDRLF